MWLLASLFLAGYWSEISILLHVGLSESHLSVSWPTVAGKLASDVRQSKEKRERERETKTEGIVFYNLILEVIFIPSTIFYWLPRATLIQCGRDHTRVWISRGRDHSGLSWKLLQFPWTSLPEGRLRKGKLVGQTKAPAKAAGFRVTAGTHCHSPLLSVPPITCCHPCWSL